MDRYEEYFHNLIRLYNNSDMKKLKDACIKNKIAEEVLELRLIKGIIQGITVVDLGILTQAFCKEIIAEKTNWYTT